MIGIDIEECARFSNFDDKKLCKIFTKTEIDYAKKFSNCTEHLTGFWCVKEAVIKATNKKTIPLLSIEVIHNEDGKPILNLEKLSKHFTNFKEINISISHTKNNAIAVCEII